MNHHLREKLVSAHDVVSVFFKFKSSASHTKTFEVVGLVMKIKMVVIIELSSIQFRVLVHVFKEFSSLLLVSWFHFLNQLTLQCPRYKSWNNLLETYYSKARAKLTILLFVSMFYIVEGRLECLIGLMNMPYYHYCFTNKTTYLILHQEVLSISCRRIFYISDD